MKNVKSLLPLFTLTATSMAFANPQGFQAIAGEASLSSPNPVTLEVTTGKQSIIEWDSFSIDVSETTRFIMPDTRSTVLNRVVGGRLSEIMGCLEANGKVFLINPKGVLVGENATVNTGSFIASSFDVLNGDFLRGGDLVFNGNSGSVINLGAITALDGDVVMIGLHVSNEGMINAPNGVAALAAGTEIYLRPESNEKILVRTKVSEVIADVGIKNSGLISALQTELKADGNIYSIAIKDSGRANALTKCRRLGNRIYLVAEGGKIETSGALTAPNGEIRVLGDEVALLDDAHIDVSGENSAGKVLVGGDFHGSNPDITNASSVYIAENAFIEANALLEGDGGNVVIWADKLNNFFGSIAAQGGETSGNGGLVEVSCKGELALNGNVNTLAMHGTTGMLLIDPCAVTIQNLPAVEGGFTPSPVPPCPTPPVSFDFTGNSSATIHATTIQNLLACTNVTIDASATGTGATGTISVLSPLSWFTAQTLTLNASDVGSFISFESNMTAPFGSLTVTGTDVFVGDSLGMLTKAVNVDVHTVNITTTGNISILGSNNLGASAQLRGSTLNLTASGNLAVIGGNAVNAFAAIQGLGTSTTPCAITANIVGSVTLAAGNGTSSSAAITTTDGSIALGTMMAPVNNLLIVANNIASFSNAYISTSISGGIDIFAENDVVLDAGVQPGANANIFTQGINDFDSHINITTILGDVIILGGGA